MRRKVVVQLVAGFVIALAMAATAQANGEDFFSVFEVDRPIELVYTGRVRDKATRRPINESIMFLLTDKRSGLDFPFLNDSPGHYRSPDIGASIKDLGKGEVDPSQFEIKVEVLGYKTQTLTKLPRQTAGVVSIDFRLERDPAFGPPTSGPAGEQAAPANWGLIGVGGLAALIIAALAARSLVPRQSIAR
jgi:hypothetical protein